MVFGFFVMCNDEDIKYMRMALALAERGRGHVGPNPMVGAVIVRDGRVLAQGWHHVCGSLHAERDALASCSESVGGATMYVTLEPCCHHGKQPPCTDAIIAAGISRVVMAMTDPNPLVAGHGAAILREHGIEVTSGVLEAEARHLNRIFIKYITTRRPWVVLKWAISGDSKWVSGEQSRRLVHELRGRYMGIVAGKGTVLADDPMLNCRLDGMRQPVRIIVDSKASMPPDCQLARTAREYRTVVAHTDMVETQRLEALRSCGVETLLCSCGADGMVCQLARTAREYRTVVAHTDMAEPHRLETLRSCGVETLLSVSWPGLRGNTGLWWRIRIWQSLIGLRPCAPAEWKRCCAHAVPTVWWIWKICWVSSGPWGSTRCLWRAAGSSTGV